MTPTMFYMLKLSDGSTYGPVPETDAGYVTRARAGGWIVSTDPNSLRDEYEEQQALAKNAPVSNLAIFNSFVATAELGAGDSTVRDLATVGPTCRINFTPGDIVVAYVDVEIIDPPQTYEADVRLLDDVGDFGGNGNGLHNFLMLSSNGADGNTWTRWLSSPQYQTGVDATGIGGKVPSGVWLPLLTPGVHNLSLKYFTNNATQGFRNRRLVVHQFKGS